MKEIPLSRLWYLVVGLLLILAACGGTWQPPQPASEESTNVTVLMVHRPGVDCIVVMRFNSNAPIMSCTWKVEQ